MIAADRLRPRAHHSRPRTDTWRPRIDIFLVSLLWYVGIALPLGPLFASLFLCFLVASLCVLFFLLCSFMLLGDFLSVWRVCLEMLASVFSIGLVLLVGCVSLG